MSDPAAVPSLVSLLPTFRERYLKALGSKREGEQLAHLLERALETRQFEIELYWKRANYFWAFQAVAFTVLGLLFKDVSFEHACRLLIPASIGVVTAFAGYLTARGSKFWQENWEFHVDLLEDLTSARLTQVVLCRRRLQFSVSRVNQTLLMFLGLGWAGTLLAGAFPGLAHWLLSLRSWVQGTAVSISVIVACGWLWFSTRTTFDGRVYRPGTTAWVDYPQQRRTPFMIWRTPFASDSSSGDLKSEDHTSSD